MKISTDEMTALKKIEVEILKEFVAACDELGLRYYLLGGTLLGAIRHQGFIPWDDDIDVGMPRQDYEIFLEKGQELLSKNLFIQHLRSEENYLLPFAKIRNSDTAFIQDSVKKRSMNHGIFIDVFPLDGYPEGKLKCLIQFLE